MLRKVKLVFYVVLGVLSLPVLAVLAFFLKRSSDQQVVGNAVRISGDGLQTATLTFKKPDQNQKIRLFGMIHLGQPAYYQEILEQLLADEQAGTKILYERFGPPTEKQIKALTPLEVQVLEAMQNMGQSMVTATEMLGLQYQMDKDALAPRKTWVRTDVEAVDFVRYIIDNRLDNSVIRLFGQLEGLARIKNHILTVLFSYFIARSRVLVLLFTGIFVLPKLRQFKYFLLTHRNQVGVDGIMEALQTSNRVNSTWGAAHLPGQAKLLADQGFAVTDVEWRTAFKFRQQSFVDVVKSLSDYAKQKIREEFRPESTKDSEDNQAEEK